MDITKLSEQELVSLNHKIVERLRFMQKAHTHRSMLNFNVGQAVCFEADGGRRVTGIISKFNTKTVTVVTPDGHRWNVSPSFLAPHKEPIRDVTPKNTENVVPIRSILPSNNESSGKVSRNAPCPCGSGKKHKRCCLQQQEA